MPQIRDPMSLGFAGRPLSEVGCLTPVFDMLL